MAAPEPLNIEATNAFVRRRPSRDARTVLMLRLAIIGALALAWEALSRAKLVFQDVVPSIVDIVGAFGRLFASGDFWANLGVTTMETLVALAIGALAGVLVGIALGASRFLGDAFEPYVYYFSPTPRIILFPIMIMWFGIGLASKIALGALSAFFSVALTTAAGMRQIDPVLIRVGQTFGASPWQMATKIYLPAMRLPVLNGVRLGFGTALVTVLLAETKLSNQGLGFMIMTIYTRFDMPMLYALLIVVFAVAGLGNMLLGQLAREPR